MSLPRTIQWYHSHADPIWRTVPLKKHYEHECIYYKSKFKERVMCLIVCVAPYEVEWLIQRYVY